MSTYPVSDFDIILKIIEKDIDYKFAHIKEQVELTNQIMPNCVEIDRENRKIIATHFYPDSEEEKEEMIGYIVELVNQIRIDYNSICILIYSQIEAALDLTIRNIHKKTALSRYIKQNKSSKLKNMIDFLIDKSILKLEDYERPLIDCINITLRKQRNNAVHKIYNVVTREDVINEIIGDGKNIECKLITGCNNCIDEINGLFEITKGFFKILKRV